MPARSRTDSSPGLVWTVYDIYQLPHAKNRTCKASRGQKCGPVRCLGFTACQQGFYASGTNRVGRGISPLKSCPQGPPLLHIHRQPYQLVCCNEDRVFKAFKLKNAVLNLKSSLYSLYSCTDPKITTLNPFLVKSPFDLASCTDLPKLFRREEG